MNTKVKVYISRNEYELAKNFGYHVEVFLCRGKCVDNIMRRRLTRHRLSNDEIVELDLISDASDKIRFEEDPIEVPIYYVRDSETHEISKWFAPSCGERIVNQLTDKQELHFATCFTFQYEKVDMTGTLDVYLSEGKDGRPFVRLNLHPELDGCYGHGKVFFPNREFANARPGRAVLDLSTVKEFDTYGFIGGKMWQRSPFDKEKFLDWVWKERPFMFDDNIGVFSDDTGEYAIVNPGYPSEKRIVYFDGDVIKDEAVYGYHPAKDVKHLYSETIEYMLLVSRFGEGEGGSHKTVLDDFKRQKTTRESVRRFNTRWIPKSEAPVDNLLADGVDSNFLVCCKLEGFDIYMYEIGQIAESIAFSDDELKEMAILFNAANEKAQADIMSLVKRGRLRIGG